MSEEIKNVQLKFSCSKSWDMMTNANGGRHCDKCQKKVYDFSNSNVEEFQRILAENNYNVCGRFTQQQLHTQPVVGLPLWKKWLSAAMVLISINVWGSKVFAQRTKHKQIKHTKKVAFPPPSNSSMGDIEVKNPLNAIPLNSLERISDNSSSSVEDSQLRTTQKTTPDTTQYVFGGVEVAPEFPGGQAAWDAFVNKNLNHNMGEVKGRVMITFTVEKDGSLSDVHVIKGIAKDINNECVRVVRLSPKWKSGMQDGKKVKLQYTVPIVFN
jgi:hypothetical protein